jgi:hypothetical protein
VDPEPAEVAVDKPINATVAYTKQYLVVVSGIFGVREYWVDAGSSFAIPLGSEALNGVEFIPYAVVANGVKTNGTIAVDRPINATVAYVAKALINLGLPQPYAEATLRCGGNATTAQGLFASSLEPVLYNPTTAECSVSTAVFGWPYVAAIAIAAAAIAVLARRRVTPPLFSPSLHPFSFCLSPHLFRLPAPPIHNTFPFRTAPRHGGGPQHSCWSPRWP